MFRKCNLKLKKRSTGVWNRQFWSRLLQHFQFYKFKNLKSAFNNNCTDLFDLQFLFSTVICGSISPFDFECKVFLSNFFQWMFCFRVSFDVTCVEMYGVSILIILKAAVRRAIENFNECNGLPILFLLKMITPYLLFRK